MEAQVPGNEALRLTVLRRLDLLDTPDEERFDRITRVAARVFNAPITLVSLVDENRQWFKSCLGLSMRETPRSVSFCAHAMLGSDILVIPDAAADARFSDNILVTGDPFIRFYAGQPLRTVEGLPVGTLCIMDRQPRVLNAADRAILRDLGAWAQDELNAIGASRELAQREQNEARMLAIHDNVAEAVLVTIGGIVQTANPAASRLFGREPAEIQGAPIGDLLPGWAERELDMPPGQRRQDEGVARRGRGEAFDAWVSLSGIQLDGAAATVVVVRDITEQQRAVVELHSSLEEQRRMYRDAEVARSETRAILAATSEGIALVSEGRVVTASREFAGVFGAEPQDLQGQDIAVLEELGVRAFRRPDGFLQLLNLDLDAGRRRAVLEQRWPQARDLEVLTAPVEATDQRPLGRIFLLRDVTAETELDRVKSDFVSTVAHELRTPLTAILGFSDLVLAGAAKSPEAIAADLQVIRANAVRLNQLVDDLLDVSRAESGAAAIDLRPVRLQDVVAGVALTLGPRFKAADQSLTLELPADLPEVKADQRTVEQVVGNILSNANKYTPAGGAIQVAARATDDRVELAFIDTGVGLTVDEQSKLFRKFYRARNPATQNVPGTGLGLAICRAMLTELDGEISVESRPGQGSTFTVRLPRVSG